VARSFRIEQTFSAATEPGEDLQTSLDEWHRKYPGLTTPIFDHLDD
jgi:hypothetical protein